MWELLDAYIVAFVMLLAVFAIVPTLRGFLLGGAHPINPHELKYNYLLCGALTLICYPYICFSLSFRSTQLDKSLGNLAYPIYLFHWISQSVILSNVFNWRLNRIELTAIHLLVVGAGSLVIYLFFDKPIDVHRERLIQRLFGRMSTLPAKLAEKTKPISVEAV